MREENVPTKTQEPQGFDKLIMEAYQTDGLELSTDEVNFLKDQYGDNYEQFVIDFYKDAHGMELGADDINQLIRDYGIEDRSKVDKDVFDFNTKMDEAEAAIKNLQDMEENLGAVGGYGENDKIQQTIENQKVEREDYVHNLQAKPITFRQAVNTFGEGEDDMDEVFTKSKVYMEKYTGRMRESVGKLQGLIDKSLQPLVNQINEDGVQKYDLNIDEKNNSIQLVDKETKKVTELGIPNSTQVEIFSNWFQNKTALEQQVQNNNNSIYKKREMKSEINKAAMNAKDKGLSVKDAVKEVYKKYGVDTEGIDEFSKTMEQDTWVGTAMYNMGKKVVDTISSTARGIVELASGKEDSTLYDGEFAKELDKFLVEDLDEDVKQLMYGTNKSKYNGDIDEYRVEVNGVTLIVDSKGDVQGVRKSDGSEAVNYTDKQVDAFREYEANKDKYKNDVYYKFRWGTLGAKAVQVAADMIPILGVSAATGGMGAAPMVGISTGTYLVSYGDYYKSQFEKTGDVGNASAYATAATIVTSLLEGLGGAEIAFAKKVSKKSLDKAIANVADDVALNRVVDQPSLMKRVISSLKEENLGELATELSQSFSDAGINYMFNGEGELTWQEIKETILLTPLATTPLTAITSSATHKKGLRQDLEMAARNRDRFQRIGDEWVNQGKTEEERAKRKEDFDNKMILVSEVEESINAMDELKIKSSTIKKRVLDLSEELANKKIELNSTKSNAGRKVVEGEIKDIQTKLDNLLEGSRGKSDEVISEAVKVVKEAVENNEDSEERKRTKEKLGIKPDVISPTTLDSKVSNRQELNTEFREEGINTFDLKQDMEYEVVVSNSKTQEGDLIKKGEADTYGRVVTFTNEKNPQVAAQAVYYENTKVDGAIEMAVEVGEGHKRKGIATDMYQKTANTTGKPILPGSTFRDLGSKSSTLSNEASDFWLGLQEKGIAQEVEVLSKDGKIVTTLAVLPENFQDTGTIMRKEQAADPQNHDIESPKFDTDSDVEVSFDDNTISISRKGERSDYTFQKFNKNEGGEIVSATVLDSNGKKKTIRNTDLLHEIYNNQLVKDNNLIEDEIKENELDQAITESSARETSDVPTEGADENTRAAIEEQEIAEGTRDDLLNQVVDYQGVVGTLTKNEDGTYSVRASNNQEIVVEGGESSKTNGELGLKKSSKLALVNTAIKERSERRKEIYQRLSDIYDQVYKALSSYPATGALAEELDEVAHPSPYRVGSTLLKALGKNKTNRISQKLKKEIGEPLLKEILQLEKELAVHNDQLSTKNVKEMRRQANIEDAAMEVERMREKRRMDEESARRGKEESNDSKVEKNEEKIIESTAEQLGTTATNLKGLYRVARDIFGLGRTKALYSAMMMDRMIGQMAKRDGITKKEMYGKIEFRKADSELAKKLAEDTQALLQADYVHKSSNIKHSYLKNTVGFKDAQKKGLITTDKSLSDFNGKVVVLHAPDNMFSGRVSLNNKTIVNGRGGVYFPLNFMASNFLWASTQDNVNGFIESLNNSAYRNAKKVVGKDGKVTYETSALLTLINAPDDKLFSNTDANLGLINLFTGDTFFRDIDKTGRVHNLILDGIVRAATKAFSKNSNIDLEKLKNRDTAIAEIIRILSPELSVFSERKNFFGADKKSTFGVINEILGVAKEETIRHRNNFKNNDLSLFEQRLVDFLDDYLGKKEKSARLTKVSLSEGLQQMFTEPLLVGTKNGDAYAVIEATGVIENPILDKDGKVVGGDFIEAIDSNGKHLSYDRVVKLRNGHVKVHMLKDRVGLTEGRFYSRNFGRSLDDSSLHILPPTVGASLHTDIVQVVEQNPDYNPTTLPSNMPEDFMSIGYKEVLARYYKNLEFLRDNLTGIDIERIEGQVNKPLKEKGTIAAIEAVEKQTDPEKRAKAEQEAGRAIYKLYKTGEILLRKQQDNVILEQRGRGAMISKDGRHIIYAMTNADVSTPMHEMAHVFEHYLTDIERQTVLDWAGQKEWNRETSEKFAEGFEKFLSEGAKVSNNKITEVFNSFKNWLMDIYNSFNKSPLNVELNEPMREIYSQMLNVTEVKQIKETTKKLSQFTKKDFDSLIENNLVPIPVEGTTTPNMMVDVWGRKIVVVDINGANVPFYLSTGLGGKQGTASKWYPVMGIDPNTNWFNKLSQFNGKTFQEYYGSSILRGISEALDRKYGDIRETDQGAKVARGDNSPLKVINKDFNPVPNGTQQTIDGVTNSIEKVINYLNAQEMVTKEEVEVPKVSQEVFDEFVSKGTVSQEVLESLADKIEKSIPLTTEEMAIYQNKSSEIEDILRKRDNEGKYERKSEKKVVEDTNNLLDKRFEEIRSTLEKAGFTREQIEETIAVFNSVAKRWAKRNRGKRMEDFYNDVLKGMEITDIEGKRGALKKVDGGYIMYLTTTSDISTPMHELAHIFENFLTESEKSDVLKWANETEWTRSTSEKFAEGFERWLQDDTAIPNLTAFQKFSQWLRDLYDGMSTYDRTVVLSPTMKEIYSSMANKNHVELTQKSYDENLEQKRDVLFDRMDEEGIKFNKANFEKILSKLQIRSLTVKGVMSKFRKYTPKKVEEIVQTALERGYTKTHVAAKTAFDNLSGLEDGTLDEPNINTYEWVGMSYALLNLESALDALAERLDKDPTNRDLVELEADLRRQAEAIASVLTLKRSYDGLSLGLGSKLFQKSSVSYDSMLETLVMRSGMIKRGEKSSAKAKERVSSVDKNEIRRISKGLEKNLKAIESLVENGVEYTKEQMRNIADQLISTGITNNPIFKQALKDYEKKTPTERKSSLEKDIKTLKDMMAKNPDILYQDDLEVNPEIPFYRTLRKITAKLIKENEGIVDFESLHKELINNEIDVSQEQLLDVLVWSDPAFQQSQEGKVISRKEAIKRESYLLDRVKKLLNETLEQKQKNPKAKMPKKLQELHDFVNQLAHLSAIDYTTSDATFLEAQNHLENLMKYYQDLAVDGLDFGKADIDNMVNFLRNYEYVRKMGEKKAELQKLEEIHNQLREGTYEGDLEATIPTPTKKYIDERIEKISKELRIEKEVLRTYKENENKIAILKTIINLVQSNNSVAESLDELFENVKMYHPDITKGDIVDALLYNTNKATVVKEANALKNIVRSQAKSIEKLENFMKKPLKMSRETTNAEDNLKKFRDIMKEVEKFSMMRYEDELMEGKRQDLQQRFEEITKDYADYIRGDIKNMSFDEILLKVREIKDIEQATSYSTKLVKVLAAIKINEVRGMTEELLDLLPELMPKFVGKAEGIRATLSEQNRIERLQRTKRFFELMKEDYKKQGLTDQSKTLLEKFLDTDMKRQTLNRELIKLERENQEYRRAFNEIIDRNTSIGSSKWFHELFNTPRLLVLAGDISFVLYQGLAAGVGNPKIAARSFWRMMWAGLNLQKASNYATSLGLKGVEVWSDQNSLRKADPYYDLAVTAGLRLVDPMNMALEEELRLSSTLERMKLTKYPAKKLKEFGERVYTSYMNNMRLEFFKQEIDGLIKEGAISLEMDSSGNMTMNEADYELVIGMANHVNTHTGAATRFIGNEKFDKRLSQILDASTDVLIAPRLYASVFRSTVEMSAGLGVDFYRYKKHRNTLQNHNKALFAKRRLMSNLRILTGMMVLHTLGLMTAYGLSDDDEFWNETMNPFSTNFMKIKRNRRVFSISPMVSYYRFVAKGIAQLLQGLDIISEDAFEKSKTMEKKRRLIEHTYDFFKYRLNPIIPGLLDAFFFNTDWQGNKISNKKFITEGGIFERLLYSFKASALPIYVQGAVDNAIDGTEPLEIAGEALMDFAGINSYTVDPIQDRGVQMFLDKIKYRIQYKMFMPKGLDWRAREEITNKTKKELGIWINKRLNENDPPTKSEIIKKNKSLVREFSKKYHK